MPQRTTSRDGLSHRHPSPSQPRFSTSPPAFSVATKASGAASLEERLALLVGHTRRLLWVAVTRSLEQHGESIHLYRTLGHLVRHGPATQKELATETLQHPAAVSRLLDILDKRGLVERRRDGTDRRLVRVAATRAGRARFRVLMPAVRAGVTTALRPLPLRDRKRLVVLLTKLSASSDTFERP